MPLTPPKPGDTPGGVEPDDARPQPVRCAGTLVWYHVEPDDTRGWEAAAILLCAACGEICTTGQPLDRAHALAPILREGLGSQ